MITRARFLAGIGAALAAPHLARAQESGPTRIIVPFVAGGTTDIFARLVGEKLSQSLGQQFVIENRGGAGGNIGADAVAKADPDGYTLVMGTVGTHAINASLYVKMPYDALNDFAPVAFVAGVPNLMVVNPRNVKATTVQDFISEAKAASRKFNMASSGNGTSVHLSGEMFMAMTGVKMTHVPYKGSAPALIDMLSGQCQVMFDNLPSSIEHLRAGKLRPLAVTTEVRSPALPDVPTVADTVKGYEASAWFGIGAPNGTPPEIIAQLNKAMNDALSDQKLVARLADIGGVPMKVTPEGFGKVIVSETEKWRKVVEFSGASVE